jgi:hypothetical protein
MQLPRDYHRTDDFLNLKNDIGRDDALEMVMDILARFEQSGDWSYRLKLRTPMALEQILCKGPIDHERILSAMIEHGILDETSPGQYDSPLWRAHNRGLENQWAAGQRGTQGLHAKRSLEAHGYDPNMCGTSPAGTTMRIEFAAVVEAALKEGRPLPPAPDGSKRRPPQTPPETNAPVKTTESFTQRKWAGAGSPNAAGATLPNNLSSLDELNQSEKGHPKGNPKGMGRDESSSDDELGFTDADFEPELVEAK